MPIKINHLVMVAMCALIFFMVRQFNDKLYEDKGRLTVNHSETAPDRVVFSWQSAVELPMALRMHDAFEEWKEKVRVIVLDLNSPGGSLREGSEVIAVVDQMKKTHQVITFVGQGHLCASMCVPIYLQGQKRVAAASSKWMFHEPIKVDFFTDEKVKEPEFERQATARKFFDRYFKNSEISQPWRQKLLKQMQGGKEVWRTGRQLFDENSNIIQQVF
jgi:membrane-bound ClpP family serine protease